MGSYCRNLACQKMSKCLKKLIEKERWRVRGRKEERTGEKVRGEGKGQRLWKILVNKKTFHRQKGEMPQNTRTLQVNQ